MTTNTSQTTVETNTAKYNCPYYQNYTADKGWECPRCGKINAPWISQCSCTRNNEWYTTISTDSLNIKPEWWHEITCATSPKVTLDNITK